jgi:uncharacterized protein
MKKQNKNFRVKNLKIAKSFGARLKGLLFRSRLEKSEGLLIPRCNAVHMFGMQFAIDVIFLDKQNRVVHLIKNLKPNRLSAIIFKATSVLEVPAGFIEEQGIESNDCLECV